MNGPARTPSCCSCGCSISDDGPDQTEAWLASLCGECFSVEAARELEERRAEQYDAEVQYEPRSAFV